MPILTEDQYKEKLAKRYERFTAAAERAQAESESRLNKARSMAAVIPFGQPILVGHHSESRDRNYRARIDSNFRKGYELYKKAEHYRGRAAAAESNDAIFSDNPNAQELLAEKIERLERRQELMKAANRLIKKNDRVGLAALGFSNARIDALMTPNAYGRRGFESFEITNNAGNIRNAKKRLEVVARKQTIEDSDVVLPSGVKIEYRPAENRIRIHFLGRVDAAQYKTLKYHGYRVAPSFGQFTFSGYYNYHAKVYADQIAGSESI